jgi:hypothetical protein
MKKKGLRHDVKNQMDNIALQLRGIRDTLGDIETNLSTKRFLISCVSDYAQAFEILDSLAWVNRFKWDPLWSKEHVEFNATQSAIRHLFRAIHAEREKLPPKKPRPIKYMFDNSVPPEPMV